MDRVLISDDDIAICKLIERVLRTNDIEYEIANSGEAALDLLLNQRHTFDLILMDVMLGDIEGFEVIEQVRKAGISTPIIVVTGRDEDYDAMYGLSIGADDYIIKPFSPNVLGAKIKAMIRRSRQMPQNPKGSTAGEGSAAESCSMNISHGPFHYDAAAFRFYKNDQDLELSNKEGVLFLLFLMNPGKTFSKEAIYEHVWGTSLMMDDNAIMVYINHLRLKIEDSPKHPKYIVTVRGKGYKFELEE